MLRTKKTTGVLALPSSLWQFYKHYMFKPFGWSLFLFSLACLLDHASGIIWPWMQKLIVGMFEKTVPAGMTLLEYSMPTIWLVLFLNMFMSTMSILENAMWFDNEPKLRRKISEVLTNYVHKQSMSFWTSKMSGAINTKINYVTDGVMIFNMVINILGRIMVALVNAGMLFALNKYVAYIFSGAFVFRVIYMCLLRKPIKQSSEDASEAMSSLNGKLVDSFSNYAIVKYFAGAKKEEQSLKEPRTHAVKTRVYARRMQRLSWAIPTYLWDILLATTIVLCVVFYQRGQMQIKDIVYSIFVYFSVMGAISGIINMIPELISKIADAKKAYKDLVVPIAVVDKPNASDLIVNKGIIEFKHVKFGYRNRPVLNDLFLRIKSGERVGIVGSSGAGKSTLVHLLMRFYEPKRGQILIDGQDISDVTQDSLRSNIAFIPQDATMFNRTIGENIGYGKFGASKAEIKKAAKNASADKFIMETEKKYDSLVGDKGIKLSGGQRQRIAIARAFLKNAPILVLDEATSALDSETEVAIQESFEKLSKGRTTIAIAHRLSTLRNMDRIIVLDKGEIVEQGTHQQLLRKKGKYYQLWQMQSGGFLQTENKQ